MNFEDMKKVWDSQNNETLYVLNEEAIHKSVKSKKNAASKKMTRVEVGITIINSLCALILFIDALDDPHIWDYIGSMLLIVTVIGVQVFRRKRKSGEGKFDRSILGELDHAISNTKSLLLFNALMILGYFIPICIFYTSKLVVRGATMTTWLFFAGAFLLSFLLVYFERKWLIKPRLQKLITIRQKLVTED